MKSNVRLWNWRRKWLAYASSANPTEQPQLSRDSIYLCVNVFVKYEVELRNKEEKGSMLHISEETALL